MRYLQVWEIGEIFWRYLWSVGEGKDM